MSEVIRNVRDLDADDRQALEHVLGLRLRENDQLVISVLNVQANDEAARPGRGGGSRLPDWCNVFEGMSDEEIDEIEKSIVRDPRSRFSN